MPSFPHVVPERVSAPVAPRNDIFVSRPVVSDKLSFAGEHETTMWARESFLQQARLLVLPQLLARFRPDGGVEDLAAIVTSRLIPAV